MEGRLDAGLLPDGSGRVQHQDASPEAHLRGGLDRFPAGRDAMEIVGLWTKAGWLAAARQVPQRKAFDLVLNQVGQARRQVYPDERTEM
jgi:hypothetical protein